MHTLIQAVRDLKAAVEAHDLKRAADLLIDLQRHAFGHLFAAPEGEARDLDAETHDPAELKAAVKELKAAVKAASPAKGAARGLAGGRVGKIGDGKILDLIVKILPLILALLPK